MYVDRVPAVLRLPVPWAGRAGNAEGGGMRCGWRMHAVEGGCVRVLAHWQQSRAAIAVDDGVGWRVPTAR